MEQVISSDMVFKVTSWDFPGGPEIKTLHFHCRRCGFDPWVGKIPWRREHGNPLHYSCLENTMDRGAWWALVYKVIKSWTQLK